MSRTTGETDVDVFLYGMQVGRIGPFRYLPVFLPAQHHCPPVMTELRVAVTIHKPHQMVRIAEKKMQHSGRNASQDPGTTRIVRKLFRRGRIQINESTVEHLVMESPQFGATFEPFHKGL